MERRAAKLIGGKRYPANMGERVDIESDHFVGQCKEVKSLSLAALTALVEEMDEVGKEKDKLGVVCVKLRRGTGNPSPPLMIVSEATWKEILRNSQYEGRSGTPNEGSVPTITPEGDR